MSYETPSDNAGMTADKKEKGMASKGAKEAGAKSMEGVDVPEDFQRDTHALMKAATTKHHLAHVSSKLDMKRQEMSKAENAGPASYDTGGMPE